VRESDDLTLDSDAGLLSGTDIRLFQGDLPVPTLDRRLEILNQACHKLLSYGITAVVDPGLPARFAESYELYEEARIRGTLPLRVELMNRLDYRLPFDDEYARVLEETVVPYTGDEYLRAFGIKVILDGEFSNAWLRPGEAPRVVPEVRYSTEELDRMLDLCAGRGWPLCIHVMGGGAVDAVIERVDAAAASGTYFQPWQISLAHAFLPSPRNLEDLRRLGIACSVHPLLVYVFEAEMIEAWGELAQRANPYASMRAAGLFPAGGSDVLPCEPLRGAQHAVTRRARNGAVFGPDEALSRRAALELFTSAAGPYMRRFDRGRIAPGFVADVVAWSEDPLSIDAVAWLELQAQFVAIAGEVIYES
jgi:predicted amidohydrolase YtcJ